MKKIAADPTRKGSISWQLLTTSSRDQSQRKPSYLHRLLCAEIWTEMCHWCEWTVVLQVLDITKSPYKINSRKVLFFALLWAKRNFNLQAWSLWEWRRAGEHREVLAEAGQQEGLGQAPALFASNKEHWKRWPDPHMGQKWARNCCEKYYLTWHEICLRLCKRIG